MTWTLASSLDWLSYDCFRSVVDTMWKIHPLQYPVVCTLSVPPALMEKAFGKGFQANRNGRYAQKEWDFIDINNDRFLVYDYKATTDYWGENLEEWEYEVSLSWPKRLRNTKPKRFWTKPYPSPSEFWADYETSHDFKVNCTEHAEWRKFREWIYKRIEEAKNDPLSYHDKVIQKYGPIQTYSDFDTKYEIDTDYPIYKYSRKDFNDSKWKPKTQHDTQLKPAARLPEEFRL